MNNTGKAAMIQSLDESVGRVVAKLKETDQLDNTLIIFTGDNGSQGDEFVPNFRGNKGTAYEGGTRVPLIVAGPRIETGICDVPTIGMDLYPTILSYLKAPLKPREHLDGVDIMPLLTGSGTIKDRPLYWHYPHYDETTPYSSAIVAGWKVVRYADDGKVEVYNLNKDPMEKKDLAATNPEKARSLLKFDRGRISDSSIGSRTMHTLRKLPNMSPNTPATNPQNALTITHDLVKNDSSCYSNVQRIHVSRNGHTHGFCCQLFELGANARTLVSNNQRQPIRSRESGDLSAGGRRGPQRNLLFVQPLSKFRQAQRHRRKAKADAHRRT